MADFLIVTDSTADLPADYIKANGLKLMYLSYMIDGETYANGQELDHHIFYDKMRAGSMPTTSQVNPDQAREVFEECLQQSSQILCLSFSSGLSGTYNSARVAAEEMMQEREGIQIIVIDSLCASLGEGLFVHYALQMQKQGKSLTETAEFLQNHIQNFVHVFTVDDLYNLYRGGRVSKSTAFLGTLAGIKPLLHVDSEGHLVAVGKVRGRKKSLQSLVDMMDQQIGSYRDKNDIFFISHGDCLEEAEYVAQLVKERFGIMNCIINDVGPTIGAHSGPGTMALFFMGEVR